MIDQPIFILGAHKSGTSLLRSLFDGHPRIFAVPIEAHFFQAMCYWIAYPFMKRITPQRISKAEFIKRVKGIIRYSNQEANPKGDGIAQGMFDLDRFDRAIERYTQPLQAPNGDRSAYFLAFMQAIYVSITGTELPTTTHILEKSVETAELAIDLERMFPQAKFIHIIRNPYANLVSMRKFRMFNKGSDFFPWLGTDYRSLYNSYYFLYRNRRLIPNYRIVRYEDLVRSPEATLQSLCDFIGIDFYDSLLTPTYRGQTWSGNSTSSKSFQGISASRLNAWQSQISPITANLINRYLKHVVTDFGYDLFEPQKPTLIPAPKEMPREYIANRFLWYAG